MFEETSKLVQNIYIGYYGRPADSGGLSYWANRIDTEGLGLIIEEFATSAESVALYGDLETPDHIAIVYQQLFNRESDAEGLAFYSAGIDSGELTTATVMLDILNGARNQDRQIIDNKRAIAETFGSQVTEQELAYSGEAAAGVARLLINQVNANTTPQDLSSLTQLAAEVTDLASTNEALFGELIPSGGEVGDLLGSLPEAASAEDLLNIIKQVASATLDDPTALDTLISAGGGSFASTLESLDSGASLTEILSAANENGAQGLEELLGDTATPPSPSSNAAPTITGTPATTVAEDTPYSFRPGGSDVDGDRLTYTIANNPNWLSIDANTGVVSGTPTNADVGSTENIVISVTDNIIATPVLLAAFNLEVTNTNDAPTLAAISGTATENQTLTAGAISKAC